MIMVEELVDVNDGKRIDSMPLNLDYL